MPLAGFEPTISAGERPQTYALVCATTGIGIQNGDDNNIFINCNWVVTRWQWLFYMYKKHDDDDDDNNNNNNNT